MTTERKAFDDQDTQLLLKELANHLRHTLLDSKNTSITGDIETMLLCPPQQRSEFAELFTVVFRETVTRPTSNRPGDGVIILCIQDHIEACVKNGSITNKEQGIDYINSIFNPIKNSMLAINNEQFASEQDRQAAFSNYINILSNPQTLNKILEVHAELMFSQAEPMRAAQFLSEALAKGFSDELANKYLAEKKLSKNLIKYLRGPVIEFGHNSVAHHIELIKNCDPDLLTKWSDRFTVLFKDIPTENDGFIITCLSAHIAACVEKGSITNIEQGQKYIKTMVDGLLASLLKIDRDEKNSDKHTREAKLGNYLILVEKNLEKMSQDGTLEKIAKIEEILISPPPNSTLFHPDTQRALDAQGIKNPPGNALLTEVHLFKKDMAAQLFQEAITQGSLSDELANKYLQLNKLIEETLNIINSYQAKEPLDLDKLKALAKLADSLQGICALPPNLINSENITQITDKLNKEILIAHDTVLRAKLEKTKNTMFYPDAKTKKVMQEKGIKPLDETFLKKIQEAKATIAEKSKLSVSIQDPSNQMSKEYDRLNQLIDETLNIIISYQIKNPINVDKLKALTKLASSLEAIANLKPEALTRENIIQITNTLHKEIEIAGKNILRAEQEKGLKFGMRARGSKTLSIINTAIESDKKRMSAEAKAQKAAMDERQERRMSTDAKKDSSVVKGNQPEDAGLGRSVSRIFKRG